MACKACERRRKALQALRDKKAAKGKQIQAAALGAVLAATDAVGKAIGVSGEDTNESNSKPFSDVSEAGSAAESASDI